MAPPSNCPGANARVSESRLAARHRQEARLPRHLPIRTGGNHCHEVVLCGYGKIVAMGKRQALRRTAVLKPPPPNPPPVTLNAIPPGLRSGCGLHSLRSSHTRSSNKSSSVDRRRAAHLGAGHAVCNGAGGVACNHAYTVHVYPGGARRGRPCACTAAHHACTGYRTRARGSTEMQNRLSFVSLLT